MVLAAGWQCPCVPPSTYTDTAQPPIPAPSTLLPSEADGDWNTCHLQTGPQPGDTNSTARASSCVLEPQPREAGPETFIALVGCPPCQLTAGPDHPKQPLSPLPAHLLVFLDGVSPPSLPHHELFNSQEQGAVAWAGGVGDIGVRTGREERSILSCPIASHPIPSGD